MAKYIPLDVVVAEIDKKLQDLIVCKKDAFYVEERVTLRAKINMCKEILSFLDTLEVKEVDLKKEIQMFSMGLAMKENNGDWEKDIAVTAKHFFELGMAVSNKAQKGE